MITQLEIKLKYQSEEKLNYNISSVIMQENSANSAAIPAKTLCSFAEFVLAWN